MQNFEKRKNNSTHCDTNNSKTTEWKFTEIKSVMKKFCNLEIRNFNEHEPQNRLVSAFVRVFSLQWKNKFLKYKLANSSRYK